jgi:glycosyltransferase involved in cell wall biosynthesis
LNKFALINDNNEFIGETSNEKISKIPIPMQLLDGEKAYWNGKKWKYKLLKQFDFSKYKEKPKYDKDVLINIISSIPCKNGTKKIKHSGKIDILIPLYKKEKYIKRCLDSIEKQTRLDLINVVHILSQTKEDYDIVENIKSEYSFKINNIKYKQVNPSKARNILVKKSKMDWISFIDADDYFKNDFFEMFTDYEQDSMLMKPMSLDYDTEEEISERKKNFSRWRYFNICLDNLTGIYHKSLFKKFPLVEKFAFGGEDMDFLMKVYFSKRYYITLHDKFYVYTHDDGQQLTKKNSFEKTHAKMFNTHINDLRKEYEDFIMPKNIGYLKLLKLFASKKDIKIAKKINNAIAKKIKCNRKKTIDFVINEDLSYKNLNNINLDFLDEKVYNKRYENFFYLISHYNCFMIGDKLPNNFYENCLISENFEKFFNGKKIRKDVEKLTKEREKKNKKVDITFELPIPCNKNCKYCFQKERRTKTYTEEEILSSLKLRLKQCEKIAKKDKIKILPKIMGGEISILPDAFAEKILTIFNNYSNLIIFSNGANRKGVVYNSNKRLMTHITDEKQLEEIRNDLKPNESISIVYNSETKGRTRELREKYHYMDFISSMDRYQLPENRKREYIYEIPMKAIDVISGDITPCWKFGVEKINIKDVKSFKKMKVGCDKPCDNCILYE